MSSLLNLDVVVSAVKPSDYPALINDFASLVHTCTEDGSNLGWIWPFPIEAAIQFWKEQESDVQKGKTVPFVARCGDVVVGCVFLKAAWAPDAPNTAEISKLVVHPQYQRR